MLATVNLFREATMTTLDNAFQATGSGNTYTNFTAIPGSDAIWGFLTSTSQNRFSVGGTFSGWYWGVQAMGGAPDDTGNVGPAPNSYCSYAGLFGTGVYVTGAAGTSVNSVGVYGQTGELSDGQIPQGIAAGVYGATKSKYGYGVLGWSTNGPGIKGWSPVGSAVEAESVYGRAVSAFTSRETGVHGVSGDEGPNIPHPVIIGGVLGTSSTRHGVIGTSEDNVGVYGYATNGVGIVGVTGNPAAYGGIFGGNLFVSGAFTANVKNAAVPFPDGTQRVLHCMESPEHWFEDFGSAKLARGRALVRLDANFAKVIKRGDYRVFVTPEGNCHGLYVRHKNANSFEVHELTGGKSSVAFSYRIVGRRKDIKGHQRFAKIKDPLSLLPTRAARRTPSKPKPTAAELRAFIARVEKEARTQAPNGTESERRLRALRKRARPPIVPPRVPLEKIKGSKRA
jgi:hypothetical protein